MSKFVVRAEAVLEAAREHLEQIGEEFRQEVLIPLCRRRKLEFVSGMGRCVFYFEDGLTVGSAEDAVYEHKSYLVKAFEYLDAEGMGANDCLGFYVKDVRKEDW